MYEGQNIAKQAYNRSEAGYASDRVQPASAPEIPLKVERLAKNIAELQQLASMLDARLGCVLRPEAPSPASGEKLRAAAQSTIGGQLADLSDQLEVAIYRLRSTCDRLEV